MKINTKLTLGLLVISIVLLISFQKNSIPSIEIPKEPIEAIHKLDKAITISKFDTDEGIKSLQGLTDLPEYTDYKKDYILARLYERKSNLSVAISIYEKLLEKNYPLKERVLLHYAYLKAKEGNDKKALEYFTKILKEFPTSKSIPQTKYYLAQAQMRLRLQKQAYKTLLSLQKEYPKTQYGIATNYYLGEDSYSMGNYGDAINFWRKYLEFSPDGRFANEIAAIFPLIKDKYPLIPSDYTLLGNIFYHKKEYDKAIEFYKVEKDKKRFFELGYSLYRLNKKEEALPYLRGYAQLFPSYKNAKWSLLYASRCVPSFLRKSFWSRIAKEIPQLAYYAIYKEALTENNQKKREQILKDLIVLYPNTEFTLDAVWSIMWGKFQEKRYNEAEELGKKYFELAKGTINEHSETRVKIGFWLGKIAEIKNLKNEAINYYQKADNLVNDSYYTFRIRHRLTALSGGYDPRWTQQTHLNSYQDLEWHIPTIISYETLKKHFGTLFAELINLQQFDETIDLIGKVKSPSKKMTAWLQALNNEYDSSINTASTITSNNRFTYKSNLWQLAYPLYFWQYIKTTSTKYPTLDPLLVCAVIRQESRFDPTAKSVSNAYGLMQLILPTAKAVSRSVGIKLYSEELLKNPKVNIALGIHYLNGLIEELSNPLFAVASYNAGPNAVRSWVHNFKNKSSDLDFFIEEIPYEETRNYVKKVFGGYWTYLELYNN